MSKRNWTVDMIFDLIHKFGVTQTDVSRNMGISSGYFSNVLYGKYKVDKYSKRLDEYYERLKKQKIDEVVSEARRRISEYERPIKAI